MYMGGDPQQMSYVLYWLGSYTALELLYRILRGEEARRAVLWKGAMCLAGIVLGLALSGVQLIPSQELIAESVRKNGVTYSYLRGFQISPLKFWNETFLLHGRLWVIAGKVTLALTVLSLFTKRTHEQFVLWLTVAACITFAVMPEWFYQGFIKHTHVFSSARGAGRITSVIIIIATFLAAFGHGGRPMRRPPWPKSCMASILHHPRSRDDIALQR